MSFPQQLLKQIDELEEQRRALEKEKQIIYQRLSAYKKDIEKQFSYLIGKKAMCVHEDFLESQPCECVCTSVMALDDYSTVKPLFSRNGKKFIVGSYEWV